MSESTLDDLVGLLRELRDPSAGVMSRANVARELFQLVSGLQPLERRELMLEVASRTAPDLAERLVDATGAEVTSEQLTALAEALDDLGPQDVDALVERLADPEQRRDAVESVLGGSGAVVTAAVGLDVEEPEKTETTTDVQPEPSEPPPLEEAEPSDAPETLETAVAAPEEPGSTGSGDDPEAFEDPPATDEPWTDEHFGRERSWFTGRTLGIDPADEATQMSERVALASSAGASLRAFRGSLGEIANLTGEQQAEVLRAIPDGWARRRGLESLIRAGAVARRDIETLLETLTGRWPRTWVVGTLLQEDMIDVDQLSELVDPQTAGRLRRRVEPTGG